MAVDAGRGTGRAAGGIVLALAILVTVGMAGAPSASEATLSETELPGGRFSADYRAPTRIAPGIERIVGTGGVDSDDYFQLDLPAGPHSIVLEFRAPEGIGYSYSAGGVVLVETQPFAYEWAGTQLPDPIRLDHRRREQSMTVTLPPSFGGRLYVALNFTHGEDIAYSVSIPANVPVLTTVHAPEAAHTMPIGASGPLRSRPG